MLALVSYGLCSTVWGEYIRSAMGLWGPVESNETWARGIEYWVLGYAGLLEGVESELDWLIALELIGVAIAKSKLFSLKFSHSVI